MILVRIWWGRIAQDLQDQMDDAIVDQLFWAALNAAADEAAKHGMVRSLFMLYALVVQEEWQVENQIVYEDGIMISVGDGRSTKDLILRPIKDT